MLNIYKPLGWTSYDVIRKIKRTLKYKKIGHAGSLDPFASGVLLVCFEKETKKISELMELEKEYEGVMEFGVVTDTYDSDGKVIEKKPVKKYSIEFLENLLSGFTGVIEQIPPMYSAVKHSGVPLYKLARVGKIVERKSKKVTIYSLRILHYEIPFLSFRVSCSKGTYVRSLVFDIGKKLGCGAYLKSLTRTKIGKYNIEDSIFVSDVGKFFNTQK